MRSAILASGQLISANEYTPEIHGSQILCMDPSCKAPVIFVPSSDTISSHFKTSGKGESIHAINCGFFQSLSFQDSVAKVTEYQNIIQNSSKELVVRINMNAIDPDYKPRAVEREEKEKEKKDGQEVKIKKEQTPPQTVSSLRSVKKLFTSYGPDVLASIIISIKGTKVPISYLIRNYKEAHEALWTDKLNQNLPYFVHGVIEWVIRRDKVWYINFVNEDNCLYSLVIFEKYFKHFTYKDDELKGKEILAYGYLKKNTFSKEKQSTEMQIKSNSYIEFL
ncbi:hypothetical protein ACFWGC_26635 [Cytobacillus pseudoceanisediminis]|uniref:hypothetical protein n=1 Tax=Cytobacillus pseudoceanisediminis TaxID=3051614 RepID=UPI00364B092C